MDLAKQVNPLSRLKLSIVAASLVLGGSLAIIVQSPIANARASDTVLHPISFSETQHAPSTNVSPWSNHQAGGFNRERARGVCFGEQDRSGCNACTVGEEQCNAEERQNKNKEDADYPEGSHSSTLKGLDLVLRSGQ